MDHIDTYLATATQNTRYSSSIRASLAIGKRTLNRYYNKTDHSEVYRIAMGRVYSRGMNFIDKLLVLHSCHKLHYFKSAGWEPEWIETARSIVRDEFDRTYAFMDMEDNVISKNKVNSLSSKPIVAEYHLLAFVIHQYV